ncbi:hypothetical protein I6A60_40465 [Frankia sp. AgB1.9]|uniref:hypothetical protein n=1 Tax=unclassified Frankia TaxID=2632575 RepID=UPI0019339CE2|nr:MULTISPECIES: hypothetical protein [unclassified Frankia]MBL7486529.1 hypothetical protein [Frankia sp. AgW1.1]MBL7554054.1 hypothetical protein [Frankia sp. AgB1.9]MBL7618252.1 hypothetical protein [Frankia sp. AgB1.8]
MEIAVGLLALVPGARRVRVWEDGRSFSDAPSADATHVTDEETEEDDEYTEEDLAAIDRLLREAHAAQVAKWAAMFDFEAGLAAIIGRRVPAKENRPSELAEWRSATGPDTDGRPWQSAFRGRQPPV